MKRTHKGFLLEAFMQKNNLNYTINFVHMQITGSENNDFSLLGKWSNESSIEPNSPAISLELIFLSDKKIVINLNPGEQFQYNYSVEDKDDYSVLRFANDETGKSNLSILLFKIIDENTIKVQVLDYDKLPKWNKKESPINTGVLKRNLPG